MVAHHDQLVHSGGDYAALVRHDQLVHSGDGYTTLLEGPSS